MHLPIDGRVADVVDADVVHEPGLDVDLADGEMGAERVGDDPQIRRARAAKPGS